MKPLNMHKTNGNHAVDHSTEWSNWGYNEPDKFEEMLEAVPSCAKAWRLHGKPRVRRSSVPEQWEALVLQTPEMILAIKAAALFTQRDKTIKEKAWDMNHLKRLAKEQALGHGLPTKVCAYDKVVGKCRSGNYWSQAIEMSHKAQWCIIRYGCEPIEEAVDGTQKQWSLKDQAGLTDLQCRTARHALTLLKIKAHTPSAVSEWHAQHGETGNVVSSYLPRAHDGKINRMFAIAAVIAPFMLFYEHCAETGQLQRFTKFLEILRDNPRTDKWVHALVCWMEDPANSQKRCKPERLSGVLIYCVRKFLDGIPCTKSSRIHTAEWSVNKQSEQDVADVLCDNTQARAAAKALGVSISRGHQVVGYVTGMNLDFDTAITELQKIDSQELLFMLHKVDNFQRKLPCFSGRAATSFFITHIENKDTLFEFTSGIQLEIIQDAWRRALISKERLSYTPQQHAHFDLPWITKQFETYEKAQENTHQSSPHQKLFSSDNKGSQKMAVRPRRAAIHLIGTRN